MAKKSDEFIFNVKTPLGFNVRCSKRYWKRIVQKHPVLEHNIDIIKTTLSSPLLVRESKHSSDVYLFYKDHLTRWICVVTKKKNNYGFLVTAYPTDAVKGGREIWVK